jgi:RNA polymerase sigma-70 factor (ECF subfamily)
VPVRSISPLGHCRTNQPPLRSSSSSQTPFPLTIVPKSEHSSPPQVLNCVPLADTLGGLLKFHSFDEAYVERLRAGDFRTQEHFRVYFTALIQVKLRSRLPSREAIEDVRQETLVRVYVAVHEGKIVYPERLGSFVNSTCNNVLLEHYRSTARHSVLDDYDEQEELFSPILDPLAMFTAREIKQKVRTVLNKLPERDRRLLREIFLEERDKDEVCRDLDVDREYLRVLLHRAKQLFKSIYLRNNDAPGFTTA